METPEAVPVSWPALLVDVVLLPGLPVALVLVAGAGWAPGSFLGAIVIAIVFYIERGTPSPARPSIVVTATVLYLMFALFVIWLGTALSCSEPTHPSLAYVAAGTVLVGLGALSLWKRFLWGIPIAVLLALVVFFAAYAKLPGIPIDCSD
jgi:hypothetical protein